MKVFISVFGKFHAFDLAEQLNNNNLLYKIFTTYPYSYLKKYKLEKKQVISYPFLEILSRLRKFIPNFFLNYYLELLYYIFDNLCAFHINKSFDIFIGWSGFSLKSIRKSKQLKIKTVLERGSASIDYQKKILKNEYKKYNCDINIPDLFIKRELNEYRLTDFINVPSNFSKKTFNKKFKKKIFVNRYGVNTNQFRKIKKKNNKFIVLYSGGLTLQKGSHYLLKAIHELKYLKNFEFWHLGTINDEINYFINKYQTNKTKFLGHKKQKDLYRIYSQCSIFCIPSIHDGLALVIPQALSCGLPVICTENSGGKEYIKDNFNGFIIKSKSSYSIKQKILKFYNNRKLLNRMKGNTLAMIKNIDWQTYGKRTINNLNKILGS
jgi:glycosyltransferase involved in cell wall biosynthesis